ncbi:unnamed protein product [Candidula unifasciata]|uniref:J domain-containing protein n=1 Tax=Candidula unifasciata TaxID=100452 RepID=A0A8S3YYH8_9EUPU|nr:unnamed protein product [Candidula unifasciata]
MTILSKLLVYTSGEQLLNKLTKFKATFLHTTNSWFSKRYIQTHYETLGLHKNATAQEIRDAFLRLSKQYHPDVTQNDSESHTRFLKINEAYSVLSKPNSRAEYNYSLENESLKHENYNSDIPNYGFSEASNQNDPNVHGKENMFRNVKFSERTNGIHDRKDSFFYEMFKYSVYTLVLVFGMAFFISSSADNEPKKLVNNPRSTNVYMSKDELEKGQLLWTVEEYGTKMYFYAVDSESEGQKVYVGCREYGKDSTDYVYRVLTSYSRS